MRKLKLGKILSEDLVSLIDNKIINSLSEPMKASVNNSTIAFLYSKIWRITEVDVSVSVWNTISNTTI